MKLYKFVSGSKVVLTDDPQGGKLPRGRDWVHAGALEINENSPPRIGFPNSEILAGVEANGYFPPLRD